MNYLLPERLDPLARDYALGTMTGGARRRFERVLRDHAAARGAVMQWSGRLAHLAQSVPPRPPREAVWAGLEQRLFPASAGSAAHAAGAKAPWWRAWLPGRQLLGGALAGLLVAVVLVREQPEWAGLETYREDLPASYVGLLSATPGGPPSVLASSRRQGRQLTVKMLQPIQVPAGRVAQLWALPKDGAPFPIAVVPAGVAQGKSVSLPLSDTSEKLFFTVPRLGVSFEPAAALPGAVPSAEFVLAGPCVKLW
jgi:anti-sigma-K factor RskA